MYSITQTQILTFKSSAGEWWQQKHIKHAQSTKTEYDYLLLYDWIKKMVTYTNNSPKMVNPRDITGITEEGKAYASRAADLVLLPAFSIGLFPWVIPLTSKLKTPVTTKPGAWCYRVSATCGWPSVSKLCETPNLICNFCLSVAAHTTEQVHPWHTQACYTYRDNKQPASKLDDWYESTCN